MTWSAVALAGVLGVWFALTLWARARREREWEKHVTQALDLGWGQR